MSILQPYIDNGQLKIPSGQTEFTKIAIQGWTSATAQARMDNLITAHYSGGEKADAVLSPNDSLAIGIIASLTSNGHGSADKPYPVITGQDCDKPNVKAMIEGQQSMSVFKDTRTLASKVVEMVDALLQGKEAPVNDTKTYDNGVKIVLPSSAIRFMPTRTTTRNCLSTADTTPKPISTVYLSGHPCWVSGLRRRIQILPSPNRFFGCKSNKVSGTRLQSVMAQRAGSLYGDGMHFIIQ